jgi:DNA-directed RNA polymerase delta subunit
LENLKERDYLEDLGVDGKYIIMNLGEVWWEFVDWMHLDQYRDQWWAPVNKVITFEFHNRREIYCVVE